MARILWISVEMPDRAGQGGPRRQFHQIRALAQRGHVVTVLVPAGHGNEQSLRAVADVLRPRLHVRGHPVPFQLERVRRLIARPVWDVLIVAHHGSAWLLPEAVSTPVLVDFQNVTSYWYGTHGESIRAAKELAQESIAISRADAFTTCSNVETSRLLKMHPELTPNRVFTSPLGIDPAEWPDQMFSRTRPIVALFGSWAWQPNARGLDWFLTEVWPRLRSRSQDAEVLIAGTGIAAERDLPRGVRFVGRVDDLSQFAASATVVAVPVIGGVGAAMKFAESLASGAAVIATPEGANAFEDTGAFVSQDPDAWSVWMAERLGRRSSEPAPAPTRRYALENLTWAAAVLPIDGWIAEVVGSGN